MVLNLKVITETVAIELSKFVIVTVTSINDIELL